MPASRAAIAFVSFLSAPLCAEPGAPVSVASVLKETGEVARGDSPQGPHFTVSAVTPTNTGSFAKYLVFSVKLAEPVDFRGRELRYRASVNEPGKVIAHYARLYNQGEDKPCSSWLNYAFPFKNPGGAMVLWQGGAEKPMEWEAAKASGREPGKVDRIQFWFGTREAGLKLEGRVEGLTMVKGTRDALEGPGPAEAVLEGPTPVAAGKGLRERLAGAALRPEGGGTFERLQGGAGFRLSGTTRAQKNTCYFTGWVELEEPLDLAGKQLRFLARSTTPGSIVAVVARLYGENPRKPAWSFMNWGSPFKEGEIKAALARGEGGALPWQPDVSEEGATDVVRRIQFMIGSTTPDVPVEIVLTDFDLATAPMAASRIRWTEVPVYADAPARVSHPAGSVKAASLARARENLAKHDWAKALVESMRKRAAFWMDKDGEAIASWIPEEDAWFKCLCPNCGTQPEFAWTGDVLPDGRSIQCTKCAMVFPNERFPEDSTYTVKMPRGSVKTIRCYLGKDQMAQGENYGPRYHLTGAVNYVKQRKLGGVYPMALLHALGGEKAYAAKVREVLLRFAKVYPLWSVKFRATAYTSPRENFMGGKVSEWKFHDGGILPGLLNAYDLTYDSGVYSDADKLAIENGICREYKWLITAHSPSRDTCLNAVPAHMLTAALCAAMLGDHELMDWVLLGKEGFTGFLENYFTRDGFWYETAPSYANMAVEPLVPLVMALDGYSDPAAYSGPGRYDQLDMLARFPSLEGVFVGMVPAILPTGMLPAVNDSESVAKASLSQAELAAALRPSAENRALLSRVYGKSGVRGGNAHSLFLRDPATDFESPAPTPERLRKPTLLPGAGWMILRRPETFEKAATLMHYGGDVGGHTHNSTLGTLFCDFGKELSSDLGYLTWWHDLHHWMNSSFAHNIVLVDGKPQDKARQAEPVLFTTGGDILAARVAAPSCFPGTTGRYERMLIQVPLPGERQYLVDFFDVSGGQSHLWTWHADGEGFATPSGLASADFDAKSLGENGTGAEWLREGRRADLSAGAWRFEWANDPDTRTALHLVMDKPSELFLAEAPGLRDKRTPYLKVPLHLVMARASGPETVFRAVIEASQGAERVKRVRACEPAPGSPNAVVLEVQTDSGTDLVLYAPRRGAKGNAPRGPVRLRDYPGFECSADAAVARLGGDGKPKRLWMEGSGFLRFETARIDCAGVPSGKIVTVDAVHRRVLTDIPAAPPVSLAGRLLMADGVKDGVYVIESTETRSGKLELIFAPHEVVRLVPGTPFRVPLWTERSF